METKLFGTHSFYKRFNQLSTNLTNEANNKATQYKIDYLRKIVQNHKVYKFISFDDSEDKVDSKIATLKQGKIWFSFYKKLNDKTEFQINYNAQYIARRTGLSPEYIDILVNFITEVYDVYSLTYDYQEYMWKDYAANGNGICIEFEVENYDYLYPVEYVKKRHINFNKMIISAINKENLNLAIIPWVIKNPYNATSNMDSTREKEVRILYSPFDNGEINVGKIEMNIKEKLGYKGSAKPYTNFGLKISKIIIGDKCNKNVISELEKYCNEDGIRYTFLQEE